VNLDQSDDRHLRALAAIADSVAAECDRPWLIGHELAKRLTTNDRSMTSDEVAVVRALQLSLDWSDEPVGDFRSWWIDEGTESNESWPDIWAAMVKHVEHPLVVAHLSDLLWTVRHQTPHLHARRAIDVYLTSAAGLNEPHDEARALLRAHRIARSLNDNSAIESVQQLLVESVESALEGEDYGIALFILEDLANSSRGSSGDQHRQLAARVWDAAASPGMIERAAKLILRNTDDESRRLTIASRVVEAHLASARRREGLNRLVGLREALRVAEELGHPLHDEILTEIENFDAMDAFESVRSETVLPRELVSDFCAHIVGSDTLEEALMRFAIELPITPDILDGIREGTQIGIRHTVISQRIGEANSVVTSTETTTDEQDPLTAALERDVLHKAGVQAQWRSFVLLVPALHQALDSYHPWSVADVRPSLLAGEADEVVADALARGLEHFRNRRYDEAAHVALPRVERLIRHIARGCGVATTKRPTKRTGGIRGLGEILFDLRGPADGESILPEPLLTACQLTLVDPDALNLRNEMLHGTSDVTRAGDAALILQVGLALALTIRLGPAPARPVGTT
jgi:hypothetical protein